MSTNASKRKNKPINFMPKIMLWRHSLYSLANLLYAKFLERRTFPYSSSYHLTPPFSRVLIAPHLIFCSLTSPTCCNSPRKCTPVKYKKRRKTGFPIVTCVKNFKFSYFESFTHVGVMSEERLEFLERISEV